jgi:hypothetical protein
MTTTEVETPMPRLTNASSRATRKNRPACDEAAAVANVTALLDQMEG